jgi:hypothetical protein
MQRARIFASKPAYTRGITLPLSFPCRQEFCNNDKIYIEIIIKTCSSDKLLG